MAANDGFPSVWMSYKISNVLVKSQIITTLSFFVILLECDVEFSFHNSLLDVLNLKK